MKADSAQAIDRYYYPIRMRPDPSSGVMQEELTFPLNVIGQYLKGASILKWLRDRRHPSPSPGKERRSSRYQVIEKRFQRGGCVCGMALPIL